MLRRHGKKCPDTSKDNCAEAQQANGNRGKGNNNNKKRHNNGISLLPFGGGFSSSTVFSCCAISAILCLTIQTRLFSNKVYERRQQQKPFVSLDVPPPLPETSAIFKEENNNHPDDKPQQHGLGEIAIRDRKLPQREDENNGEEVKDETKKKFYHEDLMDGKAASAEPYKTEHQGTESIGGTPTTASQVQRFSPRIVHYYYDENDNLYFNHLLDPKERPALAASSDDSSPSKNLHDTSSEMKRAKQEEDTAQEISREDDINDESNVDIDDNDQNNNNTNVAIIADEEEDSAVEDKNEAIIQKNNHNNIGDHDNDNDNVDSVSEEECIPMAKWQSSSPVNCNTIHEIDILSSVLNAGARGKSNSNIKKKKRLGSSHDAAKPTTFQIARHHEEWSRYHPSWNESQAMFLGQGWFREAWKIDRQPPPTTTTTTTTIQDLSGSSAAADDHHQQQANDNDNDGGPETVILKMLRPERDFTTEFYELHRIDAVAMEQLTHSKFVLDIYGYCGQSALNEFASFRVPGLSSLEKFDRQLRGNNSPKVNRMKLKLAISVATGVAHVHELPADIVGDDRPTLAHYDLNPRNVAIVQGGRPKLNDFNVAHLLKYNPRTNLTCGFDSRLHEPWWRAPEEVSLNATSPGSLTHFVDIWSLGNLLFHILTTHSPRGKMKDYRMESVRRDVLRGIPPPLPKEYLESKDPSVVAFREAMSLCFVKDPIERADARDVANVLFQAYMKILDAEKEKEEKKKK